MLYINFYAFYLFNTLGDMALWNFYTRKYAKPVFENKIIILIDMNNSTTIAEEIGHQSFSDFSQYFLLHYLRYNNKI